MPIKTEVLIVGAGPSGLAMGADLARLGIEFKIIDSNSARSAHSKAIGVQAGTLESLKANFDSGLVDKMVEAGNPVRTAFVHFEGTPVEIDLSTIPSLHNYILILDQSETERLLEEEMTRLGVRVEREWEFKSLEQDSEGVRSVVQDGKGEVQEIESLFVVGCDGAHSKVREVLDFSFRGDTYGGEFILGDVEMQWPYGDNTIRAFPSSKGACVCFPMKGGRYRIIMLRKEQREEASQDLELGEFNAWVSELCPEKIQIERALWLTRFRVHHRITQSFQKARGFLVGDSAHIHSPAGGQGMNTGIQDALNLSHKIHQVLRSSAPASLLDRYEKERIPVARNVLLLTDLVFKRLLEKEGLLTRFIRSRIAPRVLGLPFVQKQMAYWVSEIGIARREIRRRQLA